MSSNSAAILTQVMGMPIAHLKPSDLLKHFELTIESWRQDKGRSTPFTVAYANAQSCNLFVEHPSYREAIMKTSLVYLDGNGPRIAAWLAGNRLPRRMTAPDWFDDFCRFCQAHGLGLFLLGSEAGVAAAATQALADRHPSLRILGHQHGYFEAAQEQEIMDRINALQPDVLILAMGSPYQECWMATHRSQLHVPIIWGSGGALDYISGQSKRAPAWMRSLGMEWLGRLLLEPRRLWRRYLIGIPKFAGHTLRYAIRARLRQSST